MTLSDEAADAVVKALPYNVYATLLSVAYQSSPSYIGGVLAVAIADPQLRACLMQYHILLPDIPQTASVIRAHQYGPDFGAICAAVKRAHEAPVAAIFADEPLEQTATRVRTTLQYLYDADSIFTNDDEAIVALLRFVSRACGGTGIRRTMSAEMRAAMIAAMTADAINFMRESAQVSIVSGTLDKAAGKIINFLFAPPLD